MAEAKTVKGEQELSKVSSKKEHLKELGKEGKKMRFNQRLKLEIVKPTQFYKKGQVINPHITAGEKLLKEGIAKKVIEE